MNVLISIGQARHVNALAGVMLISWSFRVSLKLIGEPFEPIEFLRIPRQIRKRIRGRNEHRSFEATNGGNQIAPPTVKLRQ